MIRLGERIKELRHRDGRTQDALAAELGVTAQAVSRWEKGICYPDLEAIPSIANYFSVSIDELFGYDNDRAKKADALAERIDEMIRQNNGKDVSMDACIALAREALIEFPGNEKLTLSLASALFTAGYVRHGEHHKEGDDGYSVYDTERHRTYAEWQEAVKLYEKLLLSLHGGEMRQKAVTELSQLYKNMGEHETALLLAQSAPDISASKIMLRINAFDGKEEVAASGEALLDLVLHSTELIESIVRTDIRMPPNIAAQMIGNAAGMFDLVCTDRFYGKSSAWLACLQMLRSYYLWLAGEKDGAFSALDTALEHAAAYDGLNEASPAFFTSPLLRHVKTNAGSLRAQSAFSAELPDVWPWWCVPKREPVKNEMQADARWDEWVRRTQG
ncbi:MAG: helix-turn-helix transcriptional regulator [Clostridia bacterium]|nr:helix-turn-helix transcriptional regulator [Clostridia bacterium]MBR6187104.1 helix-turn-helix transcriptional regulator [Clostridia bacterium]